MSVINANEHTGEVVEVYPPHLELENLLHIRIADILALLLIHSFVFHVFVVFIYLFNDVSICVKSHHGQIVHLTECLF